MKINIAILISWAWAWAGCDAMPKNTRDIGVANIVDKGREYSVAGNLPKNGIPWRLRFLCDKRGGERIKVFLRNDGPLNFTFNKGRDKGQWELKPGEKGLIFDDSFDELALVGRREEAELIFESTKTVDVKFTLSFVSEVGGVGEIKTYSHYVKIGP